MDVSPLGLTDKNLFAYCDNNPINRLDIYGDAWWSVAISAVASLSPAALVAVVTVAVVAVGITVYNEHRTLKNSSKKKSNDKHTKPRPGRLSEKKKAKKTWTRRR